VSDAALARRAIEEWHGLLQDSALAADSAERMEDEHRRQGMYFGDRPLCSVLRPRMLTVGQYGWIRRRIGSLMGAYRKIHERALVDAEFRGQFRLLDWEEEIVHFDPGFRSPCPTSRLDTFFSSDEQTLKVTEYNAETPAGPAYMDVLSEAFLGLPVTGEFLRTHVLHPLPARHGAAHRHPGLERRPHRQRVHLFPRLLSCARDGVRDRGPARVRVPRRQADRARRIRHRPDLQAGADR
jgi:hypothetical protein